MGVGLLGVLALTGCGGEVRRPAVPVRLTGAQIATELVESWLGRARACRFVVEKPVFPTWSEVGFRALAAGRCDLACTDRPPGPQEQAAFGDRRVAGYRVAFYGYALYVHPDNPLDSIFAKHIGQVFQRKIADWKELGGNQLPDLSGPIKLYGPRKASRGGMVLMQQARVWFAQPTWEVVDSDQQVLDRVAADPAALGFASLGLDRDGVRHLGIRMERGGQPAFASLEEIESQRYGLAKVIYVYCVAPPSPAAARVLDYLFSPRGQQAIEATDVWPIDRQRAQVSATP